MFGRDLPTTDPNITVVAGGRRGKDDGQQNTLAPFSKIIRTFGNVPPFIYFMPIRLSVCPTQSVRLEWCHVMIKAN